MARRSGRIAAAPATGVVSRLGGFIGLPALAALSGIIVLPVFARVAGTRDWADLSAAQAIGLFGAVVVTAGWAIWGPPAVARATDDVARRELLADSMVMRGALFLVVAAGCCAVALGTTRPHDPAAVAAMAVAMCASGLSPSWYCIGLGRPRALAAADILPRLAASLVALPLLPLLGWVGIYPVLLLVASLAGAIVFGARELSRGTWERPGRRRLAARIRHTGPAAGIDAAGNAYGATPVPIAAGSLGDAAAGFSSADRVYRLGLSLVVVTLGNALQGWTLEAGIPRPRRRQTTAVLAHLAVGLVGLVVLAGLGPPATALVFGAPLAASRPVSALYGIAFLFISLSTPLIRNLLLPAGRIRVIFAATVASAVVGLSVMSLGAVRERPDTIALGVALSEIVLVAVLAVPAHRAWHRLETEDLSSR